MKMKQCGDVLREIAMKKPSVSNGPKTRFTPGMYTSRMTLYLLNFEEKVYTLEQTLQCWKRRNLTLTGRINIVRTLGIANIQHLAFDNLEAAYRQYEQTYIFSFIWED